MESIRLRAQVPIEMRCGLPGDRDDAQSRYIEAEVHGIVVGCLSLPNGHRRPGPKFDDKLAWMAWMARHAWHAQPDGRAASGGKDRRR